MDSAAQASALVTKRDPGWSVVAVEGIAFLVACPLFLATLQWDRWNSSLLIAIALLAVVSDLTSLTSIDTDAGKLRVSGTLLGVMLAAVLLGGGPAAIIGMLAVGIGWFRSREALSGLAGNLVIYAWFPLLSGAFFHGATAVLGL